jgi:TolB-like protein/DNA-binding winged helix-turn-helix (wHTH) protein
MRSVFSGLYEFGKFRLDAQKRTLQQGQGSVALTPKAFHILLILVESAGRVVGKDELMATVWADSFVEESNLTQTIFVLRKALGQARDQGYILTVPGRGYRFTADVKTIAEPPLANAPSSASSDAAGSSAGSETIRRSWPVLLVVAGVLSLAIAAYFKWFRPRPVSVGRTMLAVMPFQNLTGDPTQEYFSDGMTEEMISQLGRLDPEHLGVIARTSVMLYKSNPKPLDQVGRELGVQYVLEGSVRRDSEKLRITAQLIDVKDQTHLWARDYDRPATGLLAVQQEITQEIANELKLRFDTARVRNADGHRAAASPNTSYEAYDPYLKGRYFLSKRTPEGFQQAAVYFQQAIAKDRSYAPAYAGLADTYALMSTWNQGRPPDELMPMARTAALRALALDESLAEPHASLALIAENYDYDWQTAEKEFRRAIQLDSGNATAHQWYGEYLSFEGRFDEALAESERARELDPLSLIIATDHASILYLERQYDAAIAQCRTVLDMDPNFIRARGILDHSYVQSGRFSEALRDAGAGYGSAESFRWGWSAYVYGRWGRKAEAEHAMKKFDQLSPQPTRLHLLAYMGTGRNDRAMQLLQQFYAQHSPVMARLKADPIYDSLRADPRFQQLLGQVMNGERGQ